MRRRSLATQFSLVIALLVTVSVGSVGALALARSRHSVRAGVLSANLAFATLTARAVEQYVSDATGILREAPRRPKLSREIRDANWPEASRVLENFVEHFTQFDAVFVQDAGGVMRVRVPSADAAGRDLSSRDFFREAVRTGEPYVSGVYVSEITGQPVVSIAVPVLGEGRRPREVLVGDLSLDAMSQFVSSIPGEDGSRIYVVDRRGRLVAHSAGLGARSLVDVGAEPIVRAALGGRSGTMEFREPGSAERLLGAHVPVARLGWGVVATRPTAAAFVPVDRLTRWLAGTALACMAGAILVGWQLARTLVGPVRRIAEATERLGAGNTHARTGLPHDGTELGQLARAFDEMAESLARQEAETRRAGEARAAAEASFAGLLEAAPDAILVADDAGRVVLFNAGAEASFGYRAPEVLGRPLAVLLPGYAVPAREGGAPGGDGPGRAGAHVELSARRKDGTEFPADATTFTLTRDGRAISGLILRDVTERRRADDALRESEARKQAMLASALDCVITIDRADRVLEFNPTAERTFGYRRADVIGRAMAELIVPPAHREAHRRGLERYLATGVGRMLGRRVEMTALRADGSEFPVELAITAIRAGESPEFTAYLRDLTEQKRTEAVARALAEVGRDLVAMRDLGRVTDRIVRTVLELFEARRAALHVRADAAAGLVCVAAVGDGDTRQWVGQPLPPGQSVAGRAVADGRIVWTPDVLADPDLTVAGALRASLERDQIRSIIAIPLIAQGETIGALSLGDRLGRVFTEQQQGLMAAFADQAALALLNARQYGEAERRRREAEVLTEVLASVTASLDLDTVLQRVTGAARELARSDLAELALRRTEGGPITSCYWTGDWHGEQRPAAVEPGRGVGGQVLVAGQPVRSAVGPPDAGDAAGTVGLQQIRASMAVPIRLEGRIEGLLIVHTREPRPFGGRDEAVLARLAEHAAIALENARLYRRSQDAYAELQRTQARLIESEASFRLMFASSPLPMWVYDRETLCFLEVNETAVAHYGYAREEFLQMRITDIRPAEDAARVRDLVATPLADLHHSGHWRHRLRDGRLVDVQIASHAFDYAGRPARLVVAEDITERRRAEEEIRRLNAELEARVRQRTTQLEAATRELEAFTYTISHDLKAPLRGMEGFSRALQEDYTERLDDTGRRYLGMIQTSVRRMGELIDDLLRYSRLERREVAREPVALGPLVRRVCEEVEDEVRARGLTVRVELDVETVEGEREGLREVLANLVGNAVKFSRDRGGTITVRSRRDGESVVLSVADEGIGFDMKYHDRIFRIFERLHRQEDYAGTGVGLAIVQKVAERHGGRAWATSEPGRGSTFFLALPAAPRGGA